MKNKMMRPYPFYGFPNFRRPYFYNYPYYDSHNTNKKPINNPQKPCSPSDLSKKEQENYSCSSNYKKNINSAPPKVEKCISNNINNNNEAETEECFEIFGLKLHFDDLLIISLLFFLYQEDVKDTYLYIALILLLLS